MTLLRTSTTSSLFYHSFYPYIRHIVFLGCLGFFSGILGGIGVSSLIPLLSFVTGDTAGQPDKIKQVVSQIFHYLSLPFSVWSLLIFIISLFILRAIFLYIFSYVRARIVYDFQLTTLNGLFANILSAQWPLLLKQKGGYMQSILLTDTKRAAEILSSLSQILLSVISVIIFFLFALAISSRIMVFTLVGGAVIFLMLYPLLKKVKSVGKEFAQESKSITQYLVEHLSGLKSIKISSVEKPVLEKSMRHFDLWKWLQLKTEMLSFLSSGAIEPISIIFILYIFYFSYSAPGFSLQAFAATIFFVQRIFVYLEGIQRSLQTISGAIPHLEHLNNFQNSLREEAEMNKGQRPFKFQKTLRFRNVSFAYLKETSVLRGVNFNLQRGEMIGLVGSSGSGKTSIADLMMRLFDPNDGSIELDDIVSSEFDLRDWRRHMGYVAQDTFLLNDTIENNIKFYDKGVSGEAVREATKKANIYEFIKNLPQGFETVVGDRGVMLSGGERQRLALARVLARRPELLILDEATSSLDNESEILIQKAIEALRGTITVFIIAHRLSTVMSADRLLVLDKGSIQEEGRPRELLQNKDSYFYRMYNPKI